MATTTNPPEVKSEGTLDRSGIAGHPAGLTTLFLTEMWERFSYYGMRALLTLYMAAALEQGGLGFSDATATSIYGTYTMFAFMTPLVGGWIADRFLGARRAVLWGGIIIAVGHFSMALSSLPGFYAGLVLICGGTGLLKGNISTMVGGLYSEDDPRRDSGFSIFYMGINLGALLAPFVCGYLGQRIGWHVGFAAAGVGMTLGLVQYVYHRKRLEHVGARPVARKASEPVAPKAKLSREEIRRLVVVFLLCCFSVIFFMILEQSGSSYTLFADRHTNNTFLGFNFPSSWFQSAGPTFVVLLAPPLSWLWIRMGKRQPSSPAKFSMGLVFVGLGTLILAFGANLTGGGVKVSPMWLISLYLVQTVGELCLSPVGLSTTTKLAPVRMVGLMMGVWFLSISMGSKLAGFMAGFYKDDPGSMFRLFGGLALIGVVSGLLMAVLVPSIKKLTAHES